MIGCWATSDHPLVVLVAVHLRSRFAPSPTGELHPGNARTALIAWLHARSAGGELVLRVEDLDEGRVRAQFLAGQLADLRWLGLDWDEGPDVGGRWGPYRQSERRHHYHSVLDRLRAKDLVYECFCSRREVAEAASAPHDASDEGPIYPGTCRDLNPAEAADRRARRAPALRFRVPAETVRFVDELQGEQQVRPREQLGDFVISRSDGVPAYQLAVVADDIDMEITHVLRGSDLLASTARQLLIYSALDAPPPVWIHVPLLLGPDGERMSKRHGAASLSALRAAGVPPAEVVGWLAATCGLAAYGEARTPAELLAGFRLADLPRADTRVGSLPWR